MIEIIKEKIWNLLKEKEVSLAMIYDKTGEILWSRGRSIAGKTVKEGRGFSKSYIKKTLVHGDMVETEDVLINLSNKELLPASLVALRVKSLMICPVKNNFFLYVDSGKKDSFTANDRITFRLMGELLGEIIKKIEQNQMKSGGITGSSECARLLRKLILKYSLEEEPVLLLGETGTGKTHIAGLIHQYSGRSGRFVVVDTPTIPENLFESVLFGHKKGSFTDARSDKRGLVTEAEGGTLFIDEISEVPQLFQAKLLRFIETRKYLVLGETIEREADVRIVAATNKNLQKAIEKNEFREDLYYRLHILELKIPPLRKRKKDLRNLVMENQRFLKGKEIGDGFWEAINRHDWPGNVRELITTLKRLGIQSEGPITGKDIDDIINQSSYKPKVAENGFVKEEEKIRQEIRAGKRFWDVIWEPFMDRELDRNTVRKLLKYAYEENSNSFKKMIDFLNIADEDYHKFMSLMHKYRIDPRDK